MKKQLRPLGDRVLVERSEALNMTAGGLYIPDNGQEKSTQGTVIAVGPGRYDERGGLVPQHVTEGDVVLFGKYAGTEVEIDGKPYVVLSESDIYGVFG